MCISTYARPAMFGVLVKDRKTVPEKNPAGARAEARSKVATLPSKVAKFGVWRPTFPGNCAIPVSEFLLYQVKLRYHWSELKLYLTCVRSRFQNHIITGNITGRADVDIANFA